MTNGKLISCCFVGVCFVTPRTRFRGVGRAQKHLRQSLRNEECLTYFQGCFVHCGLCLCARAVACAHNRPIEEGARCATEWRATAVMARTNEENGDARQCTR